jgi:hypothetical protein
VVFLHASLPRISIPSPHHPGRLGRFYPARRGAGLAWEPPDGLDLAAPRQEEGGPVTTQTPAQAPLIQAERLIIIVGKQGRYTAWYCEWNGTVADCRGHDHLTRQDALTCAEQRLRYRS